MNTTTALNHHGAALSRRGFLAGTGAAALAAGAAGGAPSFTGTRRANILLIVCDQLRLDAMSAYGCTDARTPNLDRLVQGGLSFTNHCCTNPVCGPNRSTIFTGRMTCETGVIRNGLPIRDGMPTMGEWFRQQGYETMYCGKWHLPEPYTHRIPGFDVLPVGHGEGDLVDPFVSRSVSAWLRNRPVRASQPFLVVAGFLQPHDICHWKLNARHYMNDRVPFEGLREAMPSLPPNLHLVPEMPRRLAQHNHLEGLTDLDWTQYRHVYFRQVEMLDAEVGRLLDALESSPHAKDTIVLFTSDHGEHAGCQEKVTKWTPFESSTTVPYIWYAPEHLPAGVVDREHLSSTLDLFPTFCGAAGIAPPGGVNGQNQFPLVQGNPMESREFAPGEFLFEGRYLRTTEFKYARYGDDPVEMLFDLRSDPLETNNLYRDPQYAETLRALRTLQQEYEAGLDKA
ncbi:sulfatase [Kiritimatiella glycovorans]|uniref:Choline-sulfatase n=1 Tax=Kiritimatiella glycovorans TaxID=1307763 RepID=A0A0G3EEF1_9BACT|nr:sulfatase-like hydrolase/transferase [Kiritimatiella glycovorans]AKJ64718.1 Choline-sulfatase [Kiritimatiella glycovorans]